MLIYSANTFDELYQAAVFNVIKQGKIVSPRGMKTLEILGAMLELTNPLNCLCTIKSRKLNYKFAIIEKIEYVSGESIPKRLCHYNKNIANFLNDSGEFDGAYGPRIRRQLDYVVSLLIKDKNTRQAIINVNNESDKRESKDIPCTVSLQFFIRDEKLNLIANMRSNDLLWGIPYDINGFCFLQECIASWLNLELGTYIHQVGSLHIYEDRLEQLTNVMNDSSKNDKKNYHIDAMDKELCKLAIDEFWLAEKNLREGGVRQDNRLISPFKEYFNVL